MYRITTFITEIITTQKGGEFRIQQGCKFTLNIEAESIYVDWSTFEFCPMADIHLSETNN